MSDGTSTGLPLTEEPEDNQPVSSVPPEPAAPRRGSHAGPSPAYDELVARLSFSPEVRMPDPAPELVPDTVPEPVAEALPEALPEPVTESAPLALAPPFPVADPEQTSSASRPENWASYRPAATDAADRSKGPTARLPKVSMPKVSLPKLELPKVDLPKVEVPRRTMPKVPPPHAAPPGDLPGYVEYRPSRLPRFVFSLLFAATAAGALFSIVAAISDGSRWAIGMAACVAGLSMGFWWGLIAWSPTVVTISNGMLAITQGSNSEAIDLKNPAIDVVIGMQPRSRRWRTVITRPDGSELVIRRREVDAVEFTALAEHWREVAERERQFIHERRNRRTARPTQE